ncbi:MAG: glycosyltransferase family 2 protein [Chitinophagaceae bacterium]
MILISVVIPVFNEESLIEPLFERVRNAMQAINENFEVLFVDDGSTDHTLEALKLCNGKDKRFKVLALSRNFGHPSAFTAGLHYAKGDYIVMMDGDLQDPPELIREMYDIIKAKQVDIVYGKRIEQHEKASRKVFIRLFHYVFTRVSTLKNIRNVGNFSLMSRKALNALLLLKEKNRYLPGLRSYIGFKQSFIEYSRPDRSQGEVKMSLLKLFALAFDAIFSFSYLPVKICLYSGLAGVILIIFAVIYILVGKITGLAPLGWSSIILSIYFIGSVQLLSIGILGEYVYRTYKESQNRPIFLIDKFIE